LNRENTRREYKNTLKLEKNSGNLLPHVDCHSVVCLGRPASHRRILLRPQGKEGMADHYRRCLWGLRRLLDSPAGSGTLPTATGRLHNLRDCHSCVGGTLPLARQLPLPAVNVNTARPTTPAPMDFGSRGAFLFILPIGKID